MQDRDAARPLLFNLHRARRRIRLAWADGGYAGKLQPWAATYLHSPQLGRLLHGRTADKISGAVTRVPNVAVTIIPPKAASEQPGPVAVRG